MIEALRYTARLVENLAGLVFRCLRILIRIIELIPKLPRGLRYIFLPVFAYTAFALVLVYVYAPLRGWTGQAWYFDQLKYASERWLATAIYDTDNRFVGTFDPRLDSKRDFNYAAKPIELIEEQYVASPDHKSIPVQAVPDHYWNCLKFHEDRNLNSYLNPYGVDLLGVLKIPYSSLRRSILSGRPRIGVGGSTIPMQLVRAIYKYTPHSDEGLSGKLARKFKEWWYAPVIFWALTPNRNDEQLKRWAANHLPLAQRTGGQPLYGIEQASRVIFAKTASELTVAEQFVLAAAVNHPIILLPGSEKLNKVRLDAWQRITKGRAHKCALELIKDPSQQVAVITELDRLGDGPPDPKISNDLARTLEKNVPDFALRAQANPVLRANIMAPAIRYGARREMENMYGFGWRNYVRGITLTLDVTKNLAFRQKIKAELAKLQRKYTGQIDGNYSLDVAAIRTKDGIQRELPDIVVAAANIKGEIIRYFESKDTASYFGSWNASDRQTGRYEPEQETRAIASIGKMLAAVGLANEGRDTLNTQYLDTRAPSRGLETCARSGSLRRGRRAETVFACSLSTALENRMARLGQRTSKKLIKSFGFTQPVPLTADLATPPSTAIVRGFITGSPRTVHRMAGTVLASLTGNDHQPVPLPTLIRQFDRVSTGQLDDQDAIPTDVIKPYKVIRPHAQPTLKAFLSAPLCYTSGGRKYGTLKSLSDWCAARRNSVRFHFAKTGTQVTTDAQQTVDVWASGGIQFRSGRAFSYVVLVGTGNTRRPWARRLHAAQIAAPLVRVLLNDLEGPPSKDANTAAVVDQPTRSR